MPHRPPGPHQHARRRSGVPFAAARRSAALLALVVAASASYTVQPGDTLSGIAQRLGVSVSALAQANGIADPNRIVAGRTLVLPGSSGGSTAAPAAGGATHRVGRGETLSGIALRYGVRAADLASANGISNQHRITAGQTLTVPGRSAAPSPSQAAPAASSSRPPAAAMSRSQVGDLIDRTARQHGQDPALVKAVAWQESGWGNGAVSSVGARGIMQVMPATGRFISENLAGRTLDLADPADNVLAGVLYLRYLDRLTGGDLDMTLAGYYQGLASVRRNGMYPSTHRYIANVRALTGRF